MPVTDQTPDVMLYDSNGVELAVSNGVATPVGTRGLIIAGQDDSLITRFQRMSPDGAARNNPSANKTATGILGALNATVEIDTDGVATLGATVTGVWTGTISAEATIDGVNWFSVTGFAIGRLGAVSSTTQNGNFNAITAGFKKFRARMSAYTVGNATVTFIASIASNVTTAAIAQYIQVSAGNSSTVNLAAGATFTGTPDSTLGVNAIQVTCKMDQPCTMQVQQSRDGVNWDVIDTYSMMANVGDGRTFQAAASFVRVLCTNTGGAASTFLRMDTVLCPVAEVLPRSLTPKGNLRAGIQDDDHGKQAQFGAFGTIKTVTESILGDLRFDAVSVPKQWDVTTTNLGNYAIEPGGTGIKMSTGAAAASKITLKTKQTFYYQSARGQMIKFSIILGNAGVAGNIREWGQNNGTNGIFVRMNGTVLSLVRLFNGVETVIPATSWDIPVVPNANGHIWYIQYEWLGVGNIYLYYDETIVHTINFVGSSTDFSLGTPDLPVWYRNENVANASDVYLKSGCSSVVTEGGFVISGLDATGQIREAGVDAAGALKVVIQPSSFDAISGSYGGTITLGGASVGTINAIRATAYTEQIVNAQRSINSNNAADTAAGTGARTVTITYFDQTCAGPFTEVVTLNGVANVNTVAVNICFIESMVVATVGTGLVNAGVITLHAAAGGAGVVVGTIGVGNIVAAVGDNRTLWAHHYVATVLHANVTNIVVGASANSTFLLKSKNPTSATSPEQPIGGLITAAAALDRNFPTPLHIDGPARLVVYAVPSANNATLTATFDVIEVTT